VSLWQVSSMLPWRRAADIRGTRLRRLSVRALAGMDAVLISGRTGGRRLKLFTS
jgi:hypothetical protein